MLPHMAQEYDHMGRIRDKYKSLLVFKDNGDFLLRSGYNCMNLEFIFVIKCLI